MHERDRATIEAELSGSGFWPIGGRWIRPSGETPDVVELVDRADWGLPADEAERLFADAMPLEGHARLCVGAPVARHMADALRARRASGRA